jgi:hypothetical protein
MIAMMKPRESWVARYQRSVKCVPGIYAIQISGGKELEEDQQYDEGEYDDDEADEYDDDE